MEFSDIRHRLEKYQRSSLLLNALLTLKAIQQDTKRKHPHWKILILIKWAYQFADDSIGKQPITSDEWAQLMKDTDAFETAYSGMSFKDHQSVRKSFRILAYQQFAHQDAYYNHILSRQVVLYLKIKKSGFDIAAGFQKKAGISLLAFLQYWYLTTLYFHLEIPYTPDVLDQRYAELFKTYYSLDECTKFLRLITVKNVQDVEALQKLKDERLQLYETNFFITKPLLYFQNNFCLPHRSLLTQTAKHFIYTFSKAHISAFPEELGRRMEAYLELGLKEAGVLYQTENSLRHLYGKGKVVDYLIGTNILVECKATELSSRSGVLRTPEILAGDLRTSIIKAYTQLIATATRIDPQREWFGIIVTYKEMYLGFGDDAWDEFMKKPISDWLIQENLLLETLPPQNLFFMDLEDWEYAMQAIKNGTATLETMLKKGRELNHHSTIAEQVFIMEQVLQKHFSIKNFDLVYLKEAESLYQIKYNY